MAENLKTEIKMEITEIQEVIYPSFVEEDSFEVHLTEEDEKMENVEIKEEVQEEIFPSTTLENPCTVHLTEEDEKRENVEIKEEIQDVIYAVNITEDVGIMENIEIKAEIQDEIPISSTVEDTCTVYIKEEDVKLEITDSQGSTLTYSLLY